MAEIIRPSRCETCKHFHHADPRQQTGECRKYPPRISNFLVPGPNNQPQNMGVTAYPALQPTQWCGEFVQKLTN